MTRRKPEGKRPGLAVCMVGLALMAGCASVVPPAPAAAPTDRYARVPFDTAWHRAILYFTDQHVPIQTIDRSSGVLASTRFQLTFTNLKAWGDCGSASTGGTTLDKLESMHNYPTTAADFNVVMQPAGDSTSVRASLGISGTVTSPAGAVPIQCVTNGQFERALFAYVSR